MSESKKELFPAKLKYYNRAGLFERIMSLRQAAMTLYDKGVMEGTSQEQISDQLTPLTQRLHDTLEDSARHDVSGCVLARQMFENQATAFEKDIAYLMGKIQDSRTHVEFINNALIRRMEADKVGDLLEDGFCVSLVTLDSGEKKLVVR